MISRLLSLLALSAIISHAEPVSLFDGKTLDGWDFDPAMWRVEDGVITGGSTTEKITHNDFICTRKSFQNFDLSLTIKCSGDPATGLINSGIQIRSVRVPGGAHMCGYQVDCGKGWFGKIYDEFRRNKVIAEPLDAAALEKAVDVYGWNTYRIRAEGPRIQVWINGVHAIDYTETDPNIALDGQIGPQVHSGGICLVQVKDVTIEELPPTPNAPTWKSLGGVEEARKKVAPPPKKAAAANAKPKRDISYNDVQGSAKTAAEQLKLFHLPEDYEIELVVQEDPANGIGKFISVYFDQRGRLWTQTALEYPVDANENPAAAEAVYSKPGKDKILVYPREALNTKLPEGGLTDPTVFADGLAIPLGILPWGNGDTCYALHGHDLLLFKDTDGDGKSDTSDVILTGFGVQDSHLFPHQFTRAPGGWIWMAQGLFNNSSVKRPGSDEVIDWPKCSMARMRPDGSEFEVTSTGPNNIWGLVITGEGETFIQEANDYGYPVMPFHDYAYYPGGMAGLRKSYQPEFPPTADFRMGGTGLSGLALLENGPSVDAEAAITMLVANPITSKIQTLAMFRTKPGDEQQGNITGWRLEQRPDFLTCDDPFFRPVAMTQGPDGAIYIVDWYNKIISHNEVPRNHPDRDKTRGRIWRVKLKEGWTQRIDTTQIDPILAEIGVSSVSDPRNMLGNEAEAFWHKVEKLESSKAFALLLFLDAIEPHYPKPIPDYSGDSAMAAISDIDSRITAAKQLAAEVLTDRWQTLSTKQKELILENSKYEKFTPLANRVALHRVALDAFILSDGKDTELRELLLSRLQENEPILRITAIQGTSWLLEHIENSDAGEGAILQSLTKAALEVPFSEMFEKSPKSKLHSDPAIRRAVIQALGSSFGHLHHSNINSALKTLLAFARPSLPGPLGQSSRGPQKVPVREAYDREYERFLVRMFLERQPDLVAEFLDSDAARDLPIEARLLAALALEPQASATRVAALLPQLDRAPNDEELLRLAQFPSEPGVGDALKSLLSNASSRTVVVEKLLAQRTALDAAKIAPLLTDAAKSLLESSPQTSLQLISAFQLTDLEPDLLALARRDGFQPSLLHTLRDLRSPASEDFAKLATSKDPATRNAALEALAASRAPDAPARLLALFPDLTPAQRQAALDQLSSTKTGAKAIVTAVLDGKLAQADLAGPTVERLATVLGDDPAIAQLQDKLGGVFRPVLLLDGQDSAWADSKITLSGPFTLEGWVRLDGELSNQDSLLGSPDGPQLNFFKGTFRVYAGSALRDVAVASKPTTSGLWTHIAITRDAKGICRIYQNGELDATATRPAPDTWADCRIGWSGPAGGTEGAFCEYRVWDRARTAQEIRANFDRILATAPGMKRYDGDWGKLGKGARVAKTLDTPPLLTPEQADALDTQFARLEKLGRSGGNLENGKLLSGMCLVCHQIGNGGGQIGPNLSGVGSMGLEAILRNILTPNAAMEAGYRIFRVELNNGDLIDAFYVSEDKDAVIIRQPGAPDRRLNKTDIARTQYLRRSLMPEGLLSPLNDQQAADLLAYLLSLKG
ncbi:MAG: DUF1080 domain-containing protein [Verrucomicrobiales bacterium]|nr:DUF1080 domain-containing protein [Verrucomicrobiales bacterium]